MLSALYLRFDLVEGLLRDSFFLYILCLQRENPVIEFHDVIIFQIVILFNSGDLSFVNVI